MRPVGYLGKHVRVFLVDRWMDGSYNHCRSPLGNFSWYPMSLTAGSRTLLRASMRNFCPEVIGTAELLLSHTYSFLQKRPLFQPYLARVYHAICIPLASSGGRRALAMIWSTRQPFSLHSLKGQGGVPGWKSEIVGATLSDEAPLPASTNIHVFLSSHKLQNPPNEWPSL